MPTRPPSVEECTAQIGYQGTLIHQQRLDFRLLTSNKIPAINTVIFLTGGTHVEEINRPLVSVLHFELYVSKPGSEVNK